MSCAGENRTVFINVIRGNSEMYSMFARTLRYFFPISTSWHWYGERMRRREPDGNVSFRDPSPEEIEELEDRRDRQAY